MCTAFRALTPCDVCRCARNPFTEGIQTIHAATPRTSAANPLIWPVATSAAPALDDAVAAEAAEEAALLAGVVEALTEADEDADDALS